ncbi:sce7726 family protein [Methylobacterium sp. WL6]|uniref:sce7726 family protein n=1 Tax=Methylobacterium sp. WL6 TaxID=2603901 RepID=UPI0011C9020E|nr:sce7726 family protein [Methylobacterium sp. WL6]TXN69272.1 sce7726 family protein [Methylobacterium sp. WL6]
MRDRDVRKAALLWLEQAHVHEIDTLIVQEMGVWSGSVRIDIAVINGELQGFELKSARDNLDRLPTQVEIYSQVFDRITLVVAECHLQKAKSLLPAWWGISVAYEKTGGDLRLKTKIIARINPGIAPIQLARLLWKDEMISILDKHGFARGYRSKSSELLAERLISNLKLDSLRNEVCEALKRRQGWLRNNLSRQNNMPIDADFDPMR